MNRIELGKTGIEVSEICFGALTIGPLQRNFSSDKGSIIINAAVDSGINFIDTADLYDTYEHIAKTLKQHRDLVIATKSYAYDLKTAETTLNRALDELGRDYIDVFLLHEQESEHTLRGHNEALEYFINKKKQGVIRAVGISTHCVRAVNAAAQMDEIDVIHPILNIDGLGIADGSRLDMEEAIESAWSNDKGIYIMKPLGGGHLIGEYERAMGYAQSFEYAHSVAIGMQTVDEIDANVSFFEKGYVPREINALLDKVERTLHIHDWCDKCGGCISRCQQGALSMGRDIAMVDMTKCVLCGYCGVVCPVMAIKVL